MITLNDFGDFPDFSAERRYFYLIKYHSERRKRYAYNRNLKRWL